MAPAKSMVRTPCTPEFGAPVSIIMQALMLIDDVVIVIDDDP